MSQLGVVWRDHLDSGWKEWLGTPEMIRHLTQVALYLEKESEQYQIVPAFPLIFNALNLTPFHKVKVVCLAQDPYPDPLFSNGLAFSVNPGVRIPLSLKNIFRELAEDLSVSVRQNGSLLDWAQQGVLLLNTSLTTRAHSPGAHAGHGWEHFTDRIITLLSEEKDHLVFVLWGQHAINKESLIDPTKHLILRSSHPSFRSADKRCGPYPPFLHSHPFSQINTYLKEHGIDPIDWLGDEIPWQRLASDSDPV